MSENTLLPDSLTDEVVALAKELIRFPSVTNCPDERIDEIWHCARFITSFLEGVGLEVRLFKGGTYPSIVAGFPGALLAPVTLVGHFDVVKPEPDDCQFEPRIEGEYLWGRGSADMKTVVASYMVWMRRVMREGAPYPPINLLLVGNEENGEGESYGTPHVFEALQAESGWLPKLMIVGERTGEQGTEIHGPVCVSSRGIIRMYLTARGEKGHTGVAAAGRDLLEKLIDAKAWVGEAFVRHFTLESPDKWITSTRFPWLRVGEFGVYNIMAGEGVLGIEVRPIPEDDTEAFINDVRAYCAGKKLECVVETNEGGVACPADNPYLAKLVRAVETVSGVPAVIGKKLPGSSARFAPGGNAVVWGQAGIGPHSKEERHFIPSIAPYLAVLDEFSKGTWPQ